MRQPNNPYSSLPFAVRLVPGRALRFAGERLAPQSEHPAETPLFAAPDLLGYLRDISAARSEPNEQRFRSRYHPVNSVSSFRSLMKMILASLLLISAAHAQSSSPTQSSSNGKHPFTFEEMMKLKRVGAPVPS